MSSDLSSYQQAARNIGLYSTAGALLCLAGKLYYQHVSRSVSPSDQTPTEDEFKSRVRTINWLDMGMIAAGSSAITSGIAFLALRRFS